MAPLVNGPTTADLSINATACGTYGLDGDSSVDSAQGVEILTVDGQTAPVVVVEGPQATFVGLCGELGATGVSNASRPGLARLDFIMAGVPLGLFAGAESVFSPGFGAEAEIVLSNISVTFVRDTPNQVLGGPFSAEIAAIQNPTTLAVDPNNVNVLISIRGDDVLPLVNGPTTATISIGDVPCVEVALTGNSALDFAQDVAADTVNGAPPPPVDAVTPATFIGSDPDNLVSDLAQITPVIENNSRPGLERLDIGILMVPFSLFAANDVFTPCVENVDTGLPFPGTCISAADELAIGNITATFVRNTPMTLTGTFFPEMVAITDPVTTVVNQGFVDILISIRGADVRPLVNGLTTVSLNVNGLLFATAVLTGNSALNFADNVTVVSVNGGAPLAPPARFGPSVLPTLFVRGECNGDGKVDISDIVCSLGWQFSGTTFPGCIAALNTNGDGQVNVADPIYLITYLFKGGPQPGHPFPTCGLSVSAPDLDLGCETPPTSCTE